jgi:hypothetical protein
VQAFLASPEFLARNTSNTEFVTVLYRVFLGRIPDLAGLTAHVSALTQGATTRNQLLATFAASPEFQAIQQQLFPLPNIAGNWNMTLTASFTGCQNPSNNGAGSISGVAGWTQSGAEIETTLAIFFTSGATAQVLLHGTIAESGFFSGAFVGVTALNQQFSGNFSGLLAANMFSLQFSGRYTVGETCSINGSLTGTR